MTSAYEEAASKDEQFLFAGTADNVIEADRQAWSALESVLGQDPVGAWRLGKMIHTYFVDEDSKPKVEFAATFVRDPEATDSIDIDAALEALAQPQEEA